MVAAFINSEGNLVKISSRALFVKLYKTYVIFRPEHGNDKLFKPLKYFLELVLADLLILFLKLVFGLDNHYEIIPRGSFHSVFLYQFGRNKRFAVSIEPF